MSLIDHPRGNYRFIAGIAPYSCGVIAMPGFEIVHVTLQQPAAYRAGFDHFAQHLQDAGRPRDALCAIELRSPAPFTFDGFSAFNAEYEGLLAAWGLLLDDGKCNPLARTNVAPAVCLPSEPSLYAFSYTVPTTGDGVTPTFIVAGAGDLDDQANLNIDAVVRRGEISTDAMRGKAAVVMDVMQERLDGLGVNWSHVTMVNVYTVQALQPYLVDAILDRTGDAAAHGVHWHFANPPIDELAFEMDVRGVRQEWWIQGGG